MLEKCQNLVEIEPSVSLLPRNKTFVLAVKKYSELIMEVFQIWLIHLFCSINILSRILVVT